ncbi:MAG: TIR domain-containing protein [Solirubrobacterales bacterium]
MSVFLSYSREDSEIARRVYRGLAEAGIETWVDWRDIPATADWFEEIQEGIRESEVFVFLMSPASLDSQVCARELGTASEMEKRLIPVVIDDVSGLAIPEALARRQWIKLDSNGQSEFDLAALLTAIETDPDRLKEHTHWLGLAHRWASSGRDRSALLRGAELRSARSWLRAEQARADDPRPAQLHLEYIGASEEGAGRRQRAVAITAVGVALVGVALAVFAMTQRNEALSQEKTARSQALAATSLLRRDVDPVEALQLAKSAVDTEPTTEAADALRESLIETRAEGVIPGDNPVQSLAEDADGQRLYIGYQGGSVSTWEEGAGSSVSTADVLPTGVSDLEVNSASGDLVAANEFTGGGTAELLSPEGESLESGFTAPSTDGIRDVEFSPDGELLAQAPDAGAIRVWRIDHPDDFAEIDRSTGNLVAFGPSSDLLLAAGQTDGAALFDSSNGKLVRTLTTLSADEHAISIDYNFNGTRVAVARGPFESGPSTIDLVDPRNGELIASLPDPALVTIARFSEDGDRLATGDSGGVVRVWDAGTGDLVATMSGHTGAINDLAFSEEGGLLATGSADGTARLWEANTGRAVSTLTGHFGGVTKVMFLKRGKRLATGGLDGSVRLWSADEFGPAFEELRTQRLPREASISAAADSGEYVFARLSNGSVLLDGRYYAIGFDGFAYAPNELPIDVTGEHKPLFATQQPEGDSDTVTLRAYQAPGDPTNPENSVPFRTITVPNQRSVTFGAVSPDDTLLALPALHSGIRLVSLETDSPTPTTLSSEPSADPDPARGKANVEAIDFSGDGSRVAAALSDGRTSVWDVDSGSLVETLEALEPPDSSEGGGAFVELNSDGSNALVSASWDPIGKVVRVGDGVVLGELRTPGDYVKDASFAPEDALLATTHADGGIRIWRPDGSLEYLTVRPTGGSANQIAFSGSRLASFLEEDLGEARGRARFECLVCGSVQELSDRAATLLDGLPGETSTSP